MSAHAGRPADGLGWVRVVVDPDHPGHLALLATNETDPVVATVPVEEMVEGTGDLFDFVITTPVAKLVAKVFKGKADADLWLRLVYAPPALVVTDISGMLSGRSLTVHAEETAQCDLRVVDVAKELLDACGLPLAASASVALAPGSLAAWRLSADEIGGLPLRVTTGRQFVVAAGALGSGLQWAIVGAGLTVGSGGGMGAERTVGDRSTLEVLERLHTLHQVPEVEVRARRAALEVVHGD